MNPQDPTSDPAPARRGKVVYGLADLEVDTALQRVVRQGAEVPLPRLSYDLLLALIEAAPAVVSNEELMARVWPGLVVAEKTVNQRVKLLRDALGDDPQAPRYIGGLRGRGYRALPDVAVRPRPSASGAATPAGTPDAAAAPAHVIEASPPVAADASAPAASAVPAVRAEEVHADPVPPPPRRRAQALAAFAALAVLALPLGTWWALDRTNPAVPQEAREGAVPAAAGNSVAVLPFRLLNASPDDSYLARGLAEMVIDQLASVSALQVVARSSSFAVTDDRTAQGTRAIAERLHVRYLVDGTVQVEGTKARAVLRLIDAQEDRQVWSTQVVQERAALFELQEDLANRVAMALQSRLATATPRAPSRPPATRNTEAYLHYLQGRALLASWSVVATDDAIASFRRAIEADPGFAAAWASLFDALMTAEARREYGLFDVPFARASAAIVAQRQRHDPLIRRALALDPECADAYYARAMWALARTPEQASDFARAFELDPGNGRGITAYAQYLDSVQRRPEAEALLRRAIAIDPLAPRAHFMLVTRESTRGKSGQQLQAEMLRVLQIAPDYQPALQRYAKYRWMFDGDMANALRVLEHARARDPENASALHLATAIYLDIGDVERARSVALDPPGRSAGSANASRNTATVPGPGELLLVQHQGDLRRAGALARDVSAYRFGPFEAWGVWEAVRDDSLASGRIEEGITYLRRLTGLEGAAPEITITNFRAIPALAHLLRQAGREAEARALLQRGLAWVNDVHLATLNPVYAMRAKASMLLLLGQREEALAALRHGFETARDYQQWWYTLRLDPLWQPLHDDPAFVRIVRHVEAHVAEQRARLERDRSTGGTSLPGLGARAP